MKIKQVFLSGTYPLVASKRGFLGIVERMAVLWEQRNLIRALDIVSKESMADSKEILGRLKEKYKKSAKDFAHSYITGGTGEHWIYENELLNYFLKKDNKSTLDIDYIVNYQRVLESCIKEDFILSQDNDDFLKKEEDDNDIRQTSLRQIQVSYDKGAEILNCWYFWFRYMPTTFPEPAKIVTSILISVITATLTSGAIWLWLLK